MTTWTLNQIKYKLDSFKSFLVAKGAEIQEPTNEYEILRFKTDKGISVVYTKKSGIITFFGEASKAWLCFKNIDFFDWRAVPYTKLKKSKNGTLNAIRKRDGHLCFFCQKMVDFDDESEEHLVSRTHNGPDHIANKVLAHRSCNSKAGHLSVKEKINIHVAAVIEMRGLKYG